MSTVITRNDQVGDQVGEQWRQWQRRYAASSRKTAGRARVVFAILLTGTSAWLALQIALSAWN